MRNKMSVIYSLCKLNFVENRIVIYLMKRMAPVEISKAIRIPSAIGTDVEEEEEEVTFLCCIDDKNKRDEQ
jgi:hypothetical protein